MGMQFIPKDMAPDQLVSTEGVKEYIEFVKSRAASRFLKYSDWMKELDATGDFLSNIKENQKVKGIKYRADMEMIVSCIEALTKLLAEIQKKTPVDFSKFSLLNGFKKMGISTIQDTIVTTDYSAGLWMKKVEGYKTLKELGWSKSNAPDYARKLLTALKNAGKQNAYETWIVGTINTYTRNKEDKEQYSKLSKCVKQAQMVFEIRHRLIIDARKTFVSLKKVV